MVIVLKYGLLLYPTLRWYVSQLKKLGLFWVCFGFVFLGRKAVHFHNPFVKKRLRSFWVFRELGLFIRTTKSSFFL